MIISILIKYFNGRIQDEIFFCIIVLVSTVFLNACDLKKEVESKPNVLVIVADDLGYADLSFLPYASEDVHTPNIDRIADRGVFFSNAYSTSPICSPSRTGILTGRYHERWGNYWYGEGGLPANEKTLPQYLKELGYYNVKVGKTHLNGGPVQHPLDHGFDEFLGFIDHTWDYLRLGQEDVDRYGKANAKKAHIGPLIENRKKKSFDNSFTTDIFTEKTIEAIQDKTDQPLYIELEYNAVHHPTYVTHPDYLEKYGIDQFPFWDPKQESYQKWHRKWGHLGKVDPDGRKRYLTHLEVMDTGIGKILDALESSGEIENTIIIFLSDNGGTINTYARNEPLNGYKYMFGEGGIRIPMIISYPSKITQRQTVHQLVSGMDILPTILEVVSENIPENLDGKSVWASIEENESIHEELVWSNGRDSWVVRKGKWKLAHNIGWVHNTYQLEGGVARPVEAKYRYPDGTMLFDLENDIGETLNVKDEHQEIVKELKAIYADWRALMSDPRTSDGVLKEQPNKGKFIGNSLSDGDTEVASDGAGTNTYNSLIIDGYNKTFWRGHLGDQETPLPHYVILDFNAKKSFKAVKYFPVPDKQKGRVASFSLYISDDGENWGEAIYNGNLPNSDKPSEIKLRKVATTRFLKFEANEVFGGWQVAAISELDIQE